MSESAASPSRDPLASSIPDSAAALESILCAEELQSRPSRPPNYEKEHNALRALVSALADSPSTIFQTLVNVAADVIARRIIPSKEVADRPWVGCLVLQECNGFPLPEARELVD